MPIQEDAQKFELFNLPKKEIALPSLYEPPVVQIPEEDTPESAKAMADRQRYEDSLTNTKAQREDYLSTLDQNVANLNATLANEKLAERGIIMPVGPLQPAKIIKGVEGTPTPSAVKDTAPPVENTAQKIEEEVPALRNIDKIFKKTPEGLRISKTWVENNSKTLEDMTQDLGFENKEGLLKHLANAKYNPEDMVAETYIGKDAIIADKIPEVAAKATQDFPKEIGASNKVLNDNGITKGMVAELRDSEGGLYTEGYVPVNQKGTVVGKSGVTISSGVDLGQIDEKMLEELNLPKELTDKLRPYIGLKKSDAKEFLKDNPLEILPKEAFLIANQRKAQLVKNLDKVVKSDNNVHLKDLPENHREVVLNSAFQFGVYSSISRKLTKALVNGDLDAADDVLESAAYKKYSERANKLKERIRG